MKRILSILMTLFILVSFVLLVLWDNSGQKIYLISSYVCMGVAGIYGILLSFINKKEK